MADTTSLQNSLTTSQNIDMSMFGLFMAADPLVKAVMLLLVLASIWCWAIIFSKISLFKKTA